MDKPIYFVALVIFLVTVGCSSPPSEPDTPTTMTGKVIDAETGSAVARVRISTEPFTQVELTDSEGRFVIDVGVQIGQVYRIMAERDGYLPTSFEVTVVVGRNTITDIVLAKEKPQVAASPETLDFGSTANSLTFTIENAGNGGSFTWRLTVPNETWLQVDKTTGVISDQTDAVVVTIDRTGLAAGDYSTSMALTTDNNAGNVNITVRITVTG